MVGDEKNRLPNQALLRLVVSCSWRRAGVEQGQRRRRGEAREIEEAKKQARTTDFREPEPSPSLSTWWPWRPCPGSVRVGTGPWVGGAPWARMDGWVGLP